MIYYCRAELEVDVLVTAEMIPGFLTMEKDDKVILQEKLGKSRKIAKKRKTPGSETKTGGNKKKKEEKKEEEKKEEEKTKGKKLKK